MSSAKKADSGVARRPAMTAKQARSLGQQELFDRLEGLLFEARGNIAEVARRLGKDRSTVRYHLQRFGMLDDRRTPLPGKTAEAVEASDPLAQNDETRSRLGHPGRREVSSDRTASVAATSK